MQRRLSFALLLMVCGTLAGATNAFAGPSEPTQLAQAQPAAGAAAPAADAQQTVEEPIGSVATVTGSASVVRNNETTPLKIKDDIYLNDVVQTGAKSALGITFSDATTFNLRRMRRSPSTAMSMRMAARKMPESSTSPRAPSPSSPPRSPKPAT